MVGLSPPRSSCNSGSIPDSDFDFVVFLCRGCIRTLLCFGYDCCPYSKVFARDAAPACYSSSCGRAGSWVWLCVSGWVLSGVGAITVRRDEIWEEVAPKFDLHERYLRFQISHSYHKEYLDKETWDFEGSARKEGLSDMSSELEAR